jgi:hypothetical protein
VDDSISAIRIFLGLQPLENPIRLSVTTPNLRLFQARQSASFLYPKNSLGYHQKAAGEAQNVCGFNKPQLLYNDNVKEYEKELDNK